MGKLLPHREPLPGGTFLGGSGILIPLRFNVPDQDEPASSPDPSVSENPGPRESEASEEERP
jgi:hypothetical protein